MPKQIKTCRVCGAVYEACNSARVGNKAFNWREVACSPECGTVYLDRVTASRGIVDSIEESTEENTIMRFPLIKKAKKRKQEPEHVVEVEIIPTETEVLEPKNIEVTE